MKIKTEMVRLYAEMYRMQLEMNHPINNDFKTIRHLQDKFELDYLEFMHILHIFASKGLVYVSKEHIEIIPLKDM